MRNQNVAETVAALRSLEQALLDPAIRRDRAQVGALLADDFIEFGSSGRVWNRQQIIELLSLEAPRKIVIRKFECRKIAEGVVLATYRAEERKPEIGPLTSSLRSSLWVNEDGKWLMQFHQGTPIIA